MSGSTWGRELGSAIHDALAQHDALPARRKNVNRAAMGAGLLTACGYSAWWSREFTGRSAAEMTIAFVHAPAAAWLPMTWFGSLLLGVIWFVVGVAGARGPRDTMTIFWAIVRLAIAGALLWYGAYIPPDWGGGPFSTLVLRGLYLSYLAACAVETLLLLYGPPRRRLQSPTHGQARTATAEDLRGSGILR